MFLKNIRNKIVLVVNFIELKLSENFWRWQEIETFFPHTRFSFTFKHVLKLNSFTDEVEMCTLLMSETSLP